MTTPYSEPWEGATRALTATDQPSTPAPTPGSQSLRPVNPASTPADQLTPATAARRLTAISEVLVHYATVVLAWRTVLPDHAASLATVVDALMRQQETLRSVADKVEPERADETADQPPRDEQGRTPRDRIAAGLPAHVLTDEQCADVAVASGWIPDTPEARAAYLAELTDIAADEQEN